MATVNERENLEALVAKIDWQTLLKTVYGIKGFEPEAYTRIAMGLTYLGQAFPASEPVSKGDVVFRSFLSEPGIFGFK